MRDANSPDPALPRAQITGVILAGGAGQRLGGCDKGLHPLAGRPLIAHVRERLAPQVGTLLICCNRHHDRYAQFGDRLISDSQPGHAGPLHGIAAALAVCTTPYLAIAPCDTPALPAHWVARLGRQLLEHNAEVAVVHDGERLQSLCALWRVDLAGAVADHLAAGGSAPREFYRRCRSRWVDFSAEHAAFVNLNRAQEIAAYGNLIAQGHGITACRAGDG
jgi:molybdopterin-guanine dinucleotide biosynthesis protein A